MKVRTELLGFYDLKTGFWSGPVLMFFFPTDGMWLVHTDTPNPTPENPRREFLFNKLILIAPADASGDSDVVCEDAQMKAFGYLESEADGTGIISLAGEVKEASE